MHTADDSGHEACLKELLCRKANTSLRTKQGRSALDLAAKAGHAGCVTALLDAGDQPRQSSLNLAAQYGHAGCVKILLDRVARPDLAQWCGSTALFLAAGKGYADCVALLVEAGLVTDAAAKHGISLPRVAAENGRTACIKLLIDAGPAVDPSAKDEAAALGYLDNLLLLIATDHDALAPGKNGMTILHLLAKAVQLRGDANGLVEALRDAGPETDRLDDDGYGALYYAAMAGKTELIMALLNLGAE